VVSHGTGLGVLHGDWKNLVLHKLKWFL